jgi:NAD(P)-dependent dehydrogenase (short-subunit alcohol dehydrogenase family)
MTATWSEALGSLLPSKRRGGRARFLAAELMYIGEVRRLAEEAGQVDVLVNNVGGSRYGRPPISTVPGAAEFSPRGVRVNAIAAGVAHSIPEQYDMTEGFDKTSLLGRAAQVDENAEIIAFLGSDKASYVTGAVLAADGGRTAI